MSESLPQVGAHPAVDGPIEVRPVGHQREGALPGPLHHGGGPAHEADVGVGEDSDLPLVQRLSVGAEPVVLQERVAGGALDGALGPAAHPRGVPDHQHRAADRRDVGQGVADDPLHPVPEGRAAGLDRRGVRVDAQQTPAGAQHQGRPQERSGPHRRIHHREGGIPEALHDPGGPEPPVRPAEHVAADGGRRVHHPSSPAGLRGEVRVAFSRGRSHALLRTSEGRLHAGTIAETEL